VDGRLLRDCCSKEVAPAAAPEQWVVVLHRVVVLAPPIPWRRARGREHPQKTLFAGLSRGDDLSSVYSHAARWRAVKSESDTALPCRPATASLPTAVPPAPRRRAFGSRHRSRPHPQALPSHFGSAPPCQLCQVWRETVDPPGRGIRPFVRRRWRIGERMVPRRCDGRVTSC
jgi:hypothetical protein